MDYDLSTIADPTTCECGDPLYPCDYCGDFYCLCSLPDDHPALDHSTEFCCSDSGCTAKARKFWADIRARRAEQVEASIA